MGNPNDPMLEIYDLLSNGVPKKLSEMIAEKRAEMNDVSDNQIYSVLKIPKTTFYKLMKNINEDNVKEVDFYDILKVCQFFGVGIEEMSQLYVASLEVESIKDLENARKANYILRNFDIKGLKESGFINNINDFEAIENRITKFFGLSSILEYSSNVGAVAFSRTKRSSKDKMREFWLRAAFFQFEKIKNPNEYSRDDLFGLIPKISPYTRYVEKGFHHVIQSLYNIGITVIVQNYLSGTQVRGGTFVVNNKPCIVITDFNKSYPHLWFALLHEIYHVLYDFEQLKSLKYHLTGETQSDLYLFREEYADMFGWEMIFAKEKRDYVKHLIKSENYVGEYAKQNMVHPGIIYATYCEDTLKTENKNEFGFYRTLFGKSEKAIQHIKCNPWNKELLDEEIKKIQKSLTV